MSDMPSMSRLRDRDDDYLDMKAENRELNRKGQE